MSDGDRREWRFYLSVIRDDVPELLPLLQALKDEVQS